PAGAHAPVDLSQEAFRVAGSRDAGRPGGDRKSSDGRRATGAGEETAVGLPHGDERGAGRGADGFSSAHALAGRAGVSLAAWMKRIFTTETQRAQRRKHDGQGMTGGVAACFCRRKGRAAGANHGCGSAETVKQNRGALVGTVLAIPDFDAVNDAAAAREVDGPGARAGSETDVHQAVSGHVGVMKMDLDAVDLNASVFNLEANGAEGLGRAADGDAVVIGEFVHMGLAEIRPVTAFLRSKGAGDGESGQERQQKGMDCASHVCLRSFRLLNTKSGN